MLTSIMIRNFKILKECGPLPLNNAVVFIGPNNSGKTTALQALALWYYGLSKWIEKKSKGESKERQGISINRKDLFAIPILNAKHLWHNLALQSGKEGKIKIEILVEGTDNDKTWKNGLEFICDNEEVLYCKPSVNIDSGLMSESAETLKNLRMAYLPPMSGLIAQETRLVPSAVTSRIGEGRTAEVLRNLCHQILNPETPLNGGSKGSPRERWDTIVARMKKLFGVTLNDPYQNDRGDVEITYQDANNKELDIASAGRGLHQVLLLITYLLNNPHSVILLDEPDAHLEILRQRQVYNLITEMAREQGSQVIAASHSEVILNEAFGRDIVIAFLGHQPHQINEGADQLRKSLINIGFEDYYLAERKKWVLYLEGSTDLAILRAFAHVLKHPAEDDLSAPFVHYTTNLPNMARDHFHGLREAVRDLKAIAVFDKISSPLAESALQEIMWTRNEIENYFFIPDLLLRFIHSSVEHDIFEAGESSRKEKAMREAIEGIVPGFARHNPDDDYWQTCKASEQLERIFKEYHKALVSYNTMSKSRLFEIISCMKPGEVNAEIKTLLDKIHSLAIQHS
ncbi:MAG: AAA family ATPase [Fibrobacterota bacterium]